MENCRRDTSYAHVSPNPSPAANAAGSLVPVIAARQKIMALAALTLGSFFAPIRSAALLSHSAPLASSQSALDQSSLAAVLTLSDAAVSGMCRNDPVNNFDPLGLRYGPVMKYDDQGRMIGVEMEYYAPTGDEGTGYSLDAFDFIAGTKEGGLWDAFDARFEHVISRATRQYPFGDLSEMELQEAVNRGYVNKWDWPLIATRDNYGDWLVGKKGSEAITEVGLTCLAAVYFGAVFGEFGSSAQSMAPRYSATVQRSPAWRTRPEGVQVRRVAGTWVKRVNPNAPEFMQGWGRLTIQRQVDALQKLQAAGRPAARFGYLPRSGYLAVEDVSPTLTKTSYFDPGYWRAWYQDSKAIGFINDLRPENYGAGFKAFDPALDPVTISIGTAVGVSAAGGGLYIIDRIWGDE